MAALLRRDGTRRESTVSSRGRPTEAHVPRAASVMREMRREEEKKKQNEILYNKEEEAKGIPRLLFSSQSLFFFRDYVANVED